MNSFTVHREGNTIYRQYHEPNLYTLAMTDALITASLTQTIIATALYLT